MVKFLTSPVRLCQPVGCGCLMPEGRSQSAYFEIDVSVQSKIREFPSLELGITSGRNHCSVIRGKKRGRKVNGKALFPKSLLETASEASVASNSPGHHD